MTPAVAAELEFGPANPCCTAICSSRPARAPSSSLRTAAAAAGGAREIVVWRPVCASTGAAAALVAAAALPDSVRAIVSRGGRPDLAADALAEVRAPTLLIVGGNDREVLRLNEAALEALQCEKELVVVPHATHLFEEPGTLDAVALHAAKWFARHVQVSV